MGERRLSRVAALIIYPGVQLLEAVNSQTVWWTLDVATGRGNAAITAARRGCRVISIPHYFDFRLRLVRRSDGQIPAALAADFMLVYLPAMKSR
jgi:hypothetical protein